MYSLPWQQWSTIPWTIGPLKSFLCAGSLSLHSVFLSPSRADVSYQVIWITCHFVLFSSHEHDIINIVDQCDVLQNDQILQSLQIML